MPGAYSGHQQLQQSRFYKRSKTVGERFWICCVRQCSRDDRLFSKGARELRLSAQKQQEQEEEAATAAPEEEEEGHQREQQREQQLGVWVALGLGMDEVARELIDWSECSATLRQRLGDRRSMAPEEKLAAISATAKAIFRTYLQGWHRRQQL